MAQQIMDQNDGAGGAEVIIFVFCNHLNAAQLDAARVQTTYCVEQKNHPRFHP